MLTEFYQLVCNVPLSIPPWQTFLSMVKKLQWSSSNGITVYNVHKQFSEHLCAKITQLIACLQATCIPWGRLMWDDLWDFDASKLTNWNAWDHVLQILVTKCVLKREDGSWQISLAILSPHTCQHARWPVDVTELFPWFCCRTTESGFAGDIGAIEVWLIDTNAKISQCNCSLNSASKIYL